VIINLQEEFKENRQKKTSAITALVFLCIVNTTRVHDIYYEK